MHLNFFASVKCIVISAIGEPAILSTSAIALAIKEAIASYRKEHGDSTYFPMGMDVLCDIQKQYNIHSYTVIRSGITKH